MCYIEGGRPDGSVKNYPGCSNRIAPRGDKTITIPYPLYFGGENKVWGGGGGAFIGPEKDENKVTYGRMYLITNDQFVQVVRQENSQDPKNNAIQVDVVRATKDGECRLEGAGLYSRILYLGTDNGWPILTFTAARDRTIRPNAPSESYLGTIIRGLIETYSFDTETIVEYLLDKRGIASILLEEQMRNIVRKERRQGGIS